MYLVTNEVPNPDRRKVLDRILMWDKGVIEIEVPMEVRPGSINTDEGEITFLQFAKAVPDKRKPGGKGLINFFVHTTAGAFEGCQGTKVLAQMQIWRKNLGNQSFLYVDLRPVSDGTVPTHQLIGVMEQRGHERDSIPFRKEECEFFDTPAPFFGTIAIAPIDAVKREADPAKQSTTGYPGLDRKLADGWLIDNDDGKVVKLYKLKNGVKKEDVFHKPQSKNKKK